MKGIRMKLFRIAFLLGLLFLTCPMDVSLAETKDSSLPADAQAMLDHADFSFMTKALVRKDNDIDYFDHQKGKKVPLPKAVKETLVVAAKRDYERILHFHYDGSSNDKYGVNEIQSLNELYGTVLRADTPDHLQLYGLFVALYGAEGGGYYFFVLYDPATGKATKEPAIIPSHWAWPGDDPANGPLRKPYVSFEDLYGRGHDTVVLQEFFHNGTESNAAIYHYFHIEPDLSFKEVLTINGWSFYHWHDAVVAKDDETGGYHWSPVLRKVTPVGRDQLSVETTLQMDDNSLVDLGTTFLKCDKPGSPFKISGKKVKNREFEGYLDDVFWDWDRVQ